MDDPHGRTSDDTVVYAIGDVHGRADLLHRMHDAIQADAARVVARRRVVVYLGDYVDRGPDSAGVVDLLLDAPLPGFAAIPLKGNHEDFLLRFHDEGALGPCWMINGAAATLLSYSVDATEWSAGGEADFAAIRDAFRRALPRRHLAFYRGLRLHHREGDYLFVHAGVRPGVPLERQREADLLWIRHEFLDSAAPLPWIVVHGHTISAAPEIRTHRIGIDTGAYRSGRLTCLVLEGDRRRFIST